MSIKCGTHAIILKNKDGKYQVMYCHDIRNCPTCTTIAAKGLHRQLSEANLLFYLVIEEAEARRMRRKLGKGHYKRVPQADGKVIMFHDVSNQPGDPWEGNVYDLKAFVRGIPEKKRISGRLGGKAEAASRPWVEREEDMIGDDDRITIETRKFHVAGLSNDEQEELVEGVIGALREKDDGSPLKDQYAAQQQVNLYMSKVREEVIKRGLAFDLFRKTTYMDSLASINTWREIDAIRRAEAREDAAEQVELARAPLQGSFLPA